MKHLLILAACLIFFAGYGNAYAGERFSFEIRPGAAISTQNMGDADLDIGFGFDGNLAYRFLPHLAVYGGWDWHKFSADESFAGSSVDVEETGYVLGLRFIHPIGMSAFSYYFRAGATYNHIEIEDDDGNLLGDSDHGIGYEIGGGIVVPVSDRISLIPGARYRVLNRDVNVGGSITSVDLNYIAVEVGFLMTF